MCDFSNTCKIKHIITLRIHRKIFKAGVCLDLMFTSRVYSKHEIRILLGKTNTRQRLSYSFIHITKCIEMIQKSSCNIMYFNT